jgi:hypothetical protein
MSRPSARAGANGAHGRGCRILFEDQPPQSTMYRLVFQVSSKLCQKLCFTINTNSSFPGDAHDIRDPSPFPRVPVSFLWNGDSPIYYIHS